MDFIPTQAKYLFNCGSLWFIKYAPNFEINTAGFGNILGKNSKDESVGKKDVAML